MVLGFDDSQRQGQRMRICDGASACAAPSRLEPGTGDLPASLTFHLIPVDNLAGTSVFVRWLEVCFGYL